MTKKPIHLVQPTEEVQHVNEPHPILSRHPEKNSVQIAPFIPKVQGNSEILHQELDQKRVLIDPAIRLSQSRLWKIQEDYYSNQGVQAWDSNNVPFLVTNSSYIAESYAELVVAFLLDYLPHLDADEPVYLMEMAAGSGRLAYHMVKEISRKISHFSQLQHLKLTYVMTDFAEKNIGFWETHPKFQPYIEKGMLDFAVFRPDRDETVSLRLAQKELTKGSIKNPLFVVANYFFDTIRHDLFFVNKHQLQECQVALYRNIDKANPCAPVHISEVEREYAVNTVSTHYYENPRMNSILRFYEDHYDLGSIIFPVAGFQCLEHLEALSNNNLVLISSDKGFTDLEFMEGDYFHDYAIHDGAFSYMVNYDSICRYFSQAGGESFHTTEKNLSLQTVCCIEVSHPVEFSHVRYAFEEKIKRMNRANHMSRLHSGYTIDFLQPDKDRLSNTLSIIRMSNCDPAVLVENVRKITQAMEVISEEQRHDLLAILDEVWENFYYFGGEANVPFALAEIYFALDRYEQSLKFLTLTLEQYGDHEALYYLMGMCHEYLDNPLAAWVKYQKALELKPDFEEALTKLALVEQHLNHKKAG